MGPPRRPGQQRRRDLVGAPGDRAGVRVHVRRQPSRPLLSDEPAARSVPCRRPVPGRQPDIGRAPCGPTACVSTISRARRITRHGGLLPLQAGQRPLHPPAGEAARRDRRRGDGNAAHPGRVRSSFGMDGDLYGVMGFGMRLVRPFQISPQAGRQDLAPPGHVPRRRDQTGMYWVRSKPGHMSRQARSDEAAPRLWDESEQLLASCRVSHRLRSPEVGAPALGSGVRGPHPPCPDSGPEHDPAHDHQRRRQGGLGDQRVPSRPATATARRPRRTASGDPPARCGSWPHPRSPAGR